MTFRVQADLLLVHGEAQLLLDGGGHLLAGDGAEHLAVFAHPDGDLHHGVVQLFGQLPGLDAGLELPVLGGALLDVHGVHRGGVRRGGHLPGQQEVAGVSV